MPVKVFDLAEFDLHLDLVLVDRPREFDIAARSWAIRNGSWWLDSFSTRVNSSLFDEADRIAPRILGIEGPFAPGADCDAAAGIVMHLVTG